MAKNSIRIAAGLGFYGDSFEPIRASIERGNVQYVCSDHLAELTLAILQKDRARDPSLGYTRDLLPMMAALWPIAAPRGVKFVLNAGGLNPQGARDALLELFRKKGWQARIAVVTGDALLDRLDSLQEQGEHLNHMDTDVAVDTVRDRMVFANAYLGAAPIVRALQMGADIVLTGRVADAALFLAPLAHTFGWSLEPQNAAGLNLLAQGLTVGHLLECSGQGSGGNFGSAGVWAKVPDFTHMGYPIAQVSEDGTAVINKAPGTGGRVNFHTVRQQLLYEVHDPRQYFSPDVVLDMSALRLEDLGDDQVRVTGATGHKRPERLKVVAGFEDGWCGNAVVGFCWPDAMAKAHAVVESVKTQLAERKMPYQELCVEFVGHDTFLGPHADQSNVADLNEVWLRMAIRTQHKAVAESFARLLPWLALSGPPYMGGFHGVGPASQLLGLWPTTVARELVEAAVDVQMSDA